MLLEFGRIWTRRSTFSRAGVSAAQTPGPLNGNAAAASSVVRRNMSEILHPAVRKLTTVCRCNNIKYGTIERAIDAGAKTVSEVAAVTLATTGRCGGSCTSRVMEMIEARWPSAPRASGGEVSQGSASDWWVRTCEACGGATGECESDSSCNSSGTD